MIFPSISKSVLSLTIDVKVKGLDVYGNCILLIYESYQSKERRILRPSQNGTTGGTRWSQFHLPNPLLSWNVYEKQNHHMARSLLHSLNFLQTKKWNINSPLSDQLDDDRIWVGDYLYDAPSRTTVVIFMAYNLTCGLSRQQPQSGRPLRISSAINVLLHGSSSMKSLNPNKR